MRKYSPLIIPLVAGILTAAAALDRSPGKPLSFMQAREIILATNENSEAAAIGIKAAEAGVKQAGVLPNPGIAADLERFGLNEFEITLEQTFETGGKRHLRTEAAHLDIETATNEKAISNLELELEIIRRFIPIAASAKKIALMDSMIALAQTTRHRIQLRVEAGASKKTDLTRAEIAIGKLRLERDGIRSTERQARTEFAAHGTHAAHHEEHEHYALEAVGSEANHDEHEVDGEHEEHEQHSEHGEHAMEVSLSPEATRMAGITIAKAENGRIRRALDLSGEIGFNEDRLVHITPRFPGIAREVNFRIGEFVREGDVAGW
jgi:hypothetical protein